MQNNKGFITNIVLVAMVLGVVFLSQQPQFQKIGKNVYAQTVGQGSAYALNVSTWFKTSIWPKVDREVAKKQAVAQQEINQQKNNAAKIIWKKFTNYFVAGFSKIFGIEVQ